MLTLILALVSSTVVGGAPAPCHVTHSVDDYSGTQGQNGWVYGFADSGFNGGNFAPFPYFGTVNYPCGGCSSSNTWAKGANPGTYISLRKSVQLPGPLSGSSVDVIRRFSAPQPGHYSFSGFFDKYQGSSCAPLGGPLNDGVHLSIWIDGVVVWEQDADVPGAHPFEVSAMLGQGGTVDFVVNKTVTGNCDNTTVEVGVTRLVDADACPGDVDGSGAVNSADLNIVLQGFGLVEASVCEGDANEDGEVNSLDLNAVLANFGQPCPE